MFVFVSGAVRSGKSEWAERAAMALSPSGPRVYLTTTYVLDNEMRCRVELHQTARQGRGFSTLERPRDLEGVLPSLPRDATVLLECLGNWTANELFGEGGGIEDAERTIKKIHRVALMLRDRTANLLIVSNDTQRPGKSAQKGPVAPGGLLFTQAAAPGLSRNYCVVPA